jgi:hypothetical protein
MMIGSRATSKWRSMSAVEHLAEKSQGGRGEGVLARGCKRMQGITVDGSIVLVGYADSECATATRMSGCKVVGSGSGSVEC